MLEPNIATALTYVGHTDFEIAWVQPVRLVNDKYIHPLTEEEGFASFGTEYKALLSKTAENLINLYDTFKWEGPGSQIGRAISGTEPLSDNSFKEINYGNETI